MQRRVSIIMPCYNDGQYLEDSIGSVLAQDYGDIELVIADDGSTDEFTQRYLRELAALAAPRIRVLFLAHGGPAYARNRAIEAATGDYLLPLDADDMIEPPYVREAAAVLDAEPRTGMVYCHADQFGAQTGPWELPDFEIGRFLYVNSIFNAAMYRKLDWQRAGGYDESIVDGPEDWEFWLSLLELGLRPHRLDGTYFHYRRKEGAARSQTKFHLEKWLAMVLGFVEKHRRLYEQHLLDYVAASESSRVEAINCIQRLQTALRERQ